MLLGCTYFSRGFKIFNFGAGWERVSHFDCVASLPVVGAFQTIEVGKKVCWDVGRGKKGLSPVKKALHFAFGFPYSHIHPPPSFPARKTIIDNISSAPQ